MASDALDGDKSPELGPTWAQSEFRPLQLRMGTVRSSRQDGLRTSEREELSRLRRENRQLKMDREILSKAAAWFARETNSTR